MLAASFLFSNGVTLVGLLGGDWSLEEPSCGEELGSVSPTPQFSGEGRRAENGVHGGSGHTLSLPSAGPTELPGWRAHGSAGRVGAQGSFTPSPHARPCAFLSPGCSPNLCHIPL